MVIFMFLLLSLVFDLASPVICPVCDGHRCHNEECAFCQIDLHNEHSHCTAPNKGCKNDTGHICCDNEYCISQARPLTTLTCSVCDDHFCHTQKCIFCEIDRKSGHSHCKGLDCKNDTAHVCCHNEDCISQERPLTCPVCDDHGCHTQKCVACEIEFNKGHSRCKGYDCHSDHNKECCFDNECLSKYFVIYPTAASNTTAPATVNGTENVTMSSSNSTDNMTSTPATTVQTTASTTSTSSSQGSVFCLGCSDARDPGCMMNKTYCKDTQSCLVHRDPITRVIITSCMETAFCKEVLRKDHGLTECCQTSDCLFNAIQAFKVYVTAQAPSHVTSSPSTPSCFDDHDGYLNCKVLNDLYGICNADKRVYSTSYYYAYKKCRKTCGYCNETFHPTTTTVQTTSAAQQASTKCFQCGDTSSKIPCDLRSVYIGTATDCPVGKNYCQTDIYHDGTGNSKVYKRCVDENTCKSEWLDQTSDLDFCVDFGNIPMIGRYVCHYCCVGDGCNSDMIPSNSTLYSS